MASDVVLTSVSPMSKSPAIVIVPNASKVELRANWMIYMARIKNAHVEYGIIFNLIYINQ